MTSLRERERAEAESAAQHALELQRAAAARYESKLAAASSQASLELERARKELADERALTQEIVTEAKQEAATAMQQTLEAREDALRWQRAMATTPATISMPAAAGLHHSSSKRSPPHHGRSP